MKQSMVVSMTGFVHDPNQENYKNMIKHLKMRLAPVLSQETSVLIVNDVSTQKYKIAITYETPISCVSIDWLKKCMQRNRILPSNDYRIRQLFYGVEVKIVGFSDSETENLSEKINKHGGHSVILKENSQLAAIKDSDQRTSLVLTKKQNFSKLKPYLTYIPYPIVDASWVQDSFKAQLCKYPFDYALNLQNLYHKEPVEHYQKMKKKLDLQLNAQLIDHLQPKILEQTFIYFAPNVNQDLSSLLKKLVMMYGGFYLEQLLPNITHILTESVTENEYLEMRTRGILVHVLRVEWLIDSIYIHKKMKEEDYQIRSFKGRIQSSTNLEEKQNFANSMSFHSMGISTLPAALSSRKSISAINSSQTASSKLQHSHNKEIKVLKKYQSTIFKNHRFYVQSTQKKEIQLHDLASKIAKNGGEICVSRADIKEGHCFYVLKDGSDCNKLIQKLKSDTRGKPQLQPVSYRWVNECLSKCQYIDLNKIDSYIYKPFNFKIPIPSFHKMIFEVLGVDDIHKMRLKQLYNNLGSARNMVNKIQITHCLCGPSYQETARYKQLKKQNTNIKYLSWKWLTQCATAGKIVDISKYLMEKEGGHNQNKSIENIFPLSQIV